ncbi:MAG: FAD-dependent oxidoreductase [Fimbriimonas sp.]
MAMIQADVLIVGGGTGGCAAALAACAAGCRVVMTEETDWVGGQLTAQAVPPDEHPWIEQFGCTRRYRQYRNRVRQYYRDQLGLASAFRDDEFLNPGGGWVSRLCHEPKVGVAVLEAMLLPFETSGHLVVLRSTIPVEAAVVGDSVQSVTFVNQVTLERMSVRSSYVLDATETGELLPMTGTEYVIGAESRRDTGEPNAVEGDPEPDNVQGITWVFALAHDSQGEHVIERPEQYDKWRAWKPDFWPGPLLGFEVLHAHTGELRELPLYGRRPEDWYALFPYRQIVDPARFARPLDPVTIVNWPQNDYFEASILDVDSEPGEVPRLAGSSGPVSTQRLLDSKQLSLSLLYWLQTEAPRHDGGHGYPGLMMRPDITGTADGFAKYPYIRESRRIRAEFTVCEQDVAVESNSNRDRGREYADSVGIGAYRIDLHPSTNGANTIDTSSLPFQIPLGSLIPVRMENLLPACKNLGVTHITNGCYRLHPVEWNIGESAGTLAALCVGQGCRPREVWNQPILLERYQANLRAQGVELEWPRLRAL